MSDTSNPYQVPAASGEPVPVQAGEGDVTAATRQYIGKAGPWLRFLGVVGFIGCGLTGAAGIVLLIVAIAGGSIFSTSADSALIGPALSLLYIAIAVVMYFPARFVFMMGGKAKRYHQSGDMVMLEAVTLHLKQVAKFYGVIAIIGLATVPVTMVISIVAAVSHASGG